MNYVIGSGPAGVSVSHALLEQGLPVTMLDAGVKLEEDRANILSTIARSSFDDWDETAMALFRNKGVGDSKALLRKLSYGSDFPYRSSEHGVRVCQSDVEVLTSLALGGLSNVWGASVLPYRSMEISDWPVSSTDLAPHYRSVLKFMPLAGRHDSLEADFPIFSGKLNPLMLSQQAKSFERDLCKHKLKLENAHVRFGQSRLAIQTLPSGEQGGCVYCGMCQYGCPRKLIYNSSQTVEMLKGKPGFQYVGNTLVDMIEESLSGVTIRCRSTIDGNSFTFCGERVYVASGVLGTAKILLSSMKAYGRKLSMKDSQYFLCPILRWKGVAGVMHEPLHTLSQLFLEIENCRPASKPVHLQIYTYNDVFKLQLENRLGPFGRVGIGWSNPLLGRLLIAQGYLHSDDSSSISVCLKGNLNNSKLDLRAELNHLAREAVYSVVGRLRRLGFLGIVPLSTMLIFGEPGKGAHVGGLFPMRRDPGEFESDIFGRVTGFKKVHVVDASVFPNLPAPTITLNVMANAHRIGSLFAQTG